MSWWYNYASAIGYSIKFNLDGWTDGQTRNLLYYMKDIMKIEERYLRIHYDSEDSFIKDKDSMKIV
jgi:hypothetical protein